VIGNFFVGLGVDRLKYRHAVNLVNHKPNDRPCVN